MKRKLISFDAFKKIEENSLTNTQQELVKAEEVLAKTLGVDELKLFSFGESDVTYQTSDGNFIHAVYTIDNGSVILENVELLVVEEESEKNAAKQVLRNLVDSILENKTAEADKCFESYFRMPCVKRTIVIEGAAGKPSPLKGHKQPPALVALRTRKRKESIAKMSPSERKKLGRKPKKGKNPFKLFAKKTAPKKMKEWANLCENVLGYVDFQSYGPIARQSAVKTDDLGNVTAVRIPTEAKRNEAKVLSLGYKTMDTELKVLRGKMKTISENQTFVKAMADLKRYNNISDTKGLEETLEAIVARFPDLLYISEAELAQQIAVALETARVTNYDDNTCFFMAEAILRTAHHAYTDRVRKIGVLGGATTDVTAECKSCKDSYQEFAKVSDALFTQLDESEENELRIFADLYKALNEVHKLAVEANDEATRIEVADFMQECAQVLNRKAGINMELAESIADYLSDLMEGDEGAYWNGSVEVDALGDHSMTKWNAKQAAVASNNTGHFSSPAPVSDGKNADMAPEHGLGNLASGDTWPDVKNPYLLPSMMPKMKEKNVADDDGLGEDQSKDTWPNLSNPMSLKPVSPKPVV
jgi:hypothetical protein